VLRLNRSGDAIGQAIVAAQQAENPSLAATGADEYVLAYGAPQSVAQRLSALGEPVGSAVPLGSGWSPTVAGAESGAALALTVLTRENDPESDTDIGMCVLGKNTSGLTPTPAPTVATPTPPDGTGRYRVFLPLADA
jgi:hypothetical protein